MQHKNITKEFGRVRNQRVALFRTMLGSLVMEENIRTTEAKAKEIKRRIDPVINKAKKIQNGASKVTIIRELKNDLPLGAVKKIIGKYIEKFSGRKGGYSRITRLAPRKSDGAKMAVIELA